MGAPIQRLRHRISSWPFFSLLLEREPGLEVAGAPGEVGLDKVPVTFKECEGGCGPTAEQIDAKDRELADRFKGDQLLPIMGMALPH